MFWRKRQSDPPPRKWPEGYTVTEQWRYWTVHTPQGHPFGRVVAFESHGHRLPRRTLYTSDGMPTRELLADALLDLALHHEEQVRKVREAGIVFVAPRDAT